MTRWLAALALVASVARADAPRPAATGNKPAPRWLRVNFHAHAVHDHVDDDGVETPLALHEAMRAAHFDVSIHTPHCTTDKPPAAEQAYAEQRAAEGKLDVPALTIAVGEELTVADGPNYAKRNLVLGRPAPGNLNHLGIVGNKTILPHHQLTPKQACDRVHADGGICLVNHPGPGPMMWEAGYWESPDNRGHVDGLEVYNGQALAAVGIDFENRYREATSYRGLGLKIAATTGADTHGPKSVARIKSKLAALAGPASRLVRIIMPQSSSVRPELDAATYVHADGARIEDVIAAVKARHTVATYALGDVRVSLDGLGEVRKTRSVDLHLVLTRKLAEVTLYREGTPVQTWHDADHVDWRETIDAPAAFVFGAHDGDGRLLTSAVWYEPPK
jgi:hypothetical protein